MRSPALDSVKPAGYPLIIRAFTNPACRNGRRDQDKRPAGKNLLGLKIKNTAPAKHRSEMIIRVAIFIRLFPATKPPAAYRGKHQPNANGGHPAVSKIVAPEQRHETIVLILMTPQCAYRVGIAPVKAARFNAMQQKLTRRRRPVSVSAESGFRRACPQGQKDKRKLCQYAKLVCSV